MKPLISTDPVRGDVLWQGECADAASVDTAMQRAKIAQRTWQQQAFHQRAAIAERFADLALKHETEFALCISRETGKALWDAKGEVKTTAAKIAISIQAYEQRTGFQDLKTVTGSAYYQHAAHGVMGVIGPFNFPAHLPNGHIVPALLAGNSVIFKPSEQTPAVAEFMLHLWQQAGLPKQVLQLVQGDATTGSALVAHTEIDGVLFTGGEKAGLAIHRALAGRPHVMLALELGGNNPLVVWEADDLAAAASLIAFSAFVSAGQRCTCARRLIIPAGAAGDLILDALYAQLDKLTIADPLTEPNPFMGSLISAPAAKQFKQQRQHMIDQGARLLWQHDVAEQGAFVAPTLLDATQAQLLDEELFGPLLQVQRVADFDAALAAANNTRFGLAAALISSRTNLFEPFQQQIRAGIINFNKPTAGAMSAAPFGGIGLSGNHRPSAYYAADYCAYPVASMSDTLKTISLPGANT